MNDNKQMIKCNVYDCSHCDVGSDCCSLKEIRVCNCNDNKDKESTMCNSYDKRQK